MEYIYKSRILVPGSYFRNSFESCSLTKKIHLLFITLQSECKYLQENKKIEDKYY